MKKVTIYLLLISVIILSGCKDEFDYVDDFGVQHAGNPEVKWRFNFPEAKTFQNGVAPVIYKDKVFFAFQNSVFALDKNSGKLLNHWKTDEIWSLAMFKPYVYKNLIIFNGGALSPQKILAYNMDTFQKQWEVPFNAKTSTMLGIEEKLFLLQNNNLIMFNLNTQKVEKNINLSTTNGVFQFNTFPNVYFNELKQICFVTIDYPNNEKRLLNYNIDLDKIIFEKNLYMSYDVNTATRYCMVYNNTIVYNEGSGLIKCCGLKTGESLWQHSLLGRERIEGGYPTFYDNSLVVSTGDNQYLVRLNIKDGTEVWKIKSGNKSYGWSSWERFYSYKNRVYWGGGLTALNIDNGNPVWLNWAEDKRKLYLTNLKAFEDDNVFLGGINTDSKTGQSAICLKIAN